jgi:hypothetical protein
MLWCTAADVVARKLPSRFYKAVRLLAAFSLVLSSLTVFVAVCRGLA